jgi:hypothetical protein
MQVKENKYLNNTETLCSLIRRVNSKDANSPKTDNKFKTIPTKSLETFWYISIKLFQELYEKAKKVD